MGSSVRLGDVEIGPGNRCFVIAEIGVNHNGDLELARQLIAEAARAGADAVKFQTFTPALLAAAAAPKAAYQDAGDGSANQREMLEKLALDRPGHIDLQRYAAQVDVTFLSSAFDAAAVRLLDELDVPAIKIPSGELTNHRLLREVAATGRPVLMSTGMATLEEVDAAMEALGDAASRTALLHCVSSYPAAPEDANLRAMDTLRAQFRVPVGWSDHTPGIAVSTAAAALGANVIEKHLTLDRSLPGPDHAASLEPGEFAALVGAVHEVESALGDGRKMPAPAEAAIAAIARKSLHWARSMDAGTTIQVADLIALRPGTGIPASELDVMVGRRVLAPVTEGSIVTRDQVR